MRCIFFSLMVAAMLPLAHANELDHEHVVTQQQIVLSKDLPQTVIVRQSKTDPSQIEVAFLKDRLAKGKKVDVSKLAFEKIALDGEKTGIAFANGSKGELDGTSSTSSWGFHWNRWGGGTAWGGGWRYPAVNMGYYPTNWGYGGGYYAGGCGNYGCGGGCGTCGGGCGGCGGCGGGCGYNPSFYYGGGYYNYYPVYGWAAGGYNYSACNWMY